MNLTPYFQLLRLHKPIGTLLLWFPTAWALWLAGGGKPAPMLVFYFFLGTFIMRAAGCLLNDIADRHVDPHVERTKNRPLASQKISLQIAMGLLVTLLFAAFLILSQLPKTCFNYALISITLTAVYPFCKRFFEAPQLVLGLAFSMGIPMAYTAEGVAFNTTTLLLMLLNFCWIVAYDTIYAMADRDDDLQIGVKSTAILFASQDKNIVCLFQLATQIIWLILAYTLHFNLLFYMAWAIGCIIFTHQQIVIRGSNPNYFQTFSSNGLYGLIFWVALMLQH
ncbi:MAG: 4-hydroxybenzoate octaprenyltransferase [Gammaproteobacteria bacterium]|nr:4-hydroxybenzoate octaprenyltransferase [Gammaproteobacteria bacterium]